MIEFNEHEEWDTREDEEVVPRRGHPPVSGGRAERAERGEVVPSMRDLASQLVSQARVDGVDLTGEGGLLTELMRQVLQTGLEVEMEEHLGYPKHERGAGSANARNGTSPKQVHTEIGPVQLNVPRDRDGSFEPATVPKHQRRLDGLSGNVLSLYGRGLTTGDIQGHLEEIYGTRVSRETISKITDQVLVDLAAWQSRPLDPLYAVLLIDAIVVKIRTGSQVVKRAVYIAIGVNLEGERDVLGIWPGPPGGEGAKQWATMMSDLKNRGVHDALIVCCDGLKGLPDAIRLTWPEATVQTCVVHLVRNSLRYAARKDWKEIAAGTKEIYTAPTEEAAELRFLEFSERWIGAYPALIKSWNDSWDEFVPFLSFPLELRKIVYTTNAIESFNAKIRRATRHRGHFPNDQAAMKVLYLIATQRRKNRQDLTGKTHGWTPILNALTMHYGERIQATYNQ